jgi:LPS-assembly lipoprotein
MRRPNDLTGAISLNSMFGIRSLTVIGVLATLLSGCGFQLRGTVPESVGAVYVSDAKPSEVATEMRRLLNDAVMAGGNRLASKAEESAVHVRILDEAREKTIFTLASTGRVREYQLKLRVLYTMVDAKGGQLIAPAELELSRIITYAETALTGKEQEEAFLNRDMRNEAVQTIMRRLAYAKPKA